VNYLNKNIAEVGIDSQKNQSERDIIKIAIKTGTTVNFPNMSKKNLIIQTVKIIFFFLLLTE
jgi:hypothetical protein